MADEIVNRVANSILEVINLEDFYPPGERVVFDLSGWLFQGLVLKEKEFRTYVSEHDWTQYKNSFVALTCTSDAIVPAWAYMLISISLEPYAIKVFVGDLTQLESSVFQDEISKINLETYRDKPVIIKGCSEKPVPLNAYVLLSQCLRPVAKSIMFGEACSSVPLYKHKK